MDLRRSRAELLADVERRGDRIRRRRRTATALVGALALVFPLMVLASVASHRSRGVSLTAAGPPASTVPSPDGPTLPGATAAGGGRSTAVAASTTVPGSGDPGLSDCAPSDVAVTVATQNPAYAPGQTVRGFSTLQNRSGAACLLPTRSFFRIEDAGGRAVSSFPYTADYRLPVEAEPDRTVTDGFTWDQRDCSTGACVQVPPGTYMVFADWTEGGWYGGRSAFRIGS